MWDYVALASVPSRRESWQMGSEGGGGAKGMCDRPAPARLIGVAASNSAATHVCGEFCVASC